MRARLILVAIIAAAVAIAWCIRFGCDDAFISFEYARSLVRGDGLTWFGARVEGYTNFLWVLWSAAGLEVGAAPLAWAWAGSLASLVVALAATHALVRARGGTEIAALAAVGVLATNFTFLAFATSGLETMLQTALLAVAAWLCERIRRDDAPRPPRAPRLAMFSLVCALALGTRLDSAVVCVVLAVVVAQRLVRARAGLRAWAAAIAPAAILVGGWLAWKLAYYGDVLPNTFYAKAGLRAATVVHGAAFVGGFLHAYLLWPLLLAMAAVWVARRRALSGLPIAATVAWLAYVAVVGGDFMELRFFVPILPLLAVAIAETVALADASPKLPSPRVRAIAVLALLAAFSWRHAAGFDGDANDDSVLAMSTYYGLVPDGEWRDVGLAIAAPLAGTDATLACDGVGAIPYFSELPTVDQLGLTDPWVARNGVVAPDNVRPGHQRFAPLDYLVARKVTFVIGTPILVRPGFFAAGDLSPHAPQWIGNFLGAAAHRVDTLELVAVPLASDRALVLWYLTPSPAVTARIDAAGWLHRVVQVP